MIIHRNWSVEKKDEIERILISNWSSIGMEIPDNYEDIVQDVFEYVCEKYNPNDWNEFNVMYGFKRYIERIKN